MVDSHGVMGSRLARVVSKIPFLKEDSDEEDLKIISRAEWKARVPKWREDLVQPALSTTTVYTGTPPCHSPEECTRAVQDLQATHMDQDHLPDIEHSFLIGGDGRIYEGRGWYTISNRSTVVKCVDPEFPPPPTIQTDDLLKNSVERRLVIAYIGDEKKSKATELMENATRDLIEYGLKYYFIYSEDQAWSEKRGKGKEEEESGDSDEEYEH